MPYDAEISRRNPTAFFFVIDQSYSMSEPVGGTSNSKSVMLATVVNRLLNELFLRAQKGDEVWDYFEIGLISYGNDKHGPTMIGSAFGGALSGRAIVPISEVADYPLRTEKRKKKDYDATGNLIEVEVEFPVWLEPEFKGGTPMADAMAYTYNLVADWVIKHPESFPPVIIHVTDGEPSDGKDPRPAAEAMRGLATNNGNVLMFTLHLSKDDNNPNVFPSDASRLPNDFARLLFEMSSVLPIAWQSAAAEKMGMAVTAQSRAFVFNANIEKMIQFLEIGTRAPGQMR